jgi:outer membrane protein OmpA-like peptidoglycan-associated protein
MTSGKYSGEYINYWNTKERTMKQIIRTALIITLAFMLAACAASTHQERHTGTGAAIGAGVGAILGQAIGKDTEGTLLGASIGAVLGGVAGNQIGAYMDRQEQALRQAVAQSEAASIRREQDVLTATFKSDVFFDYDSYQLKPGAYTEIGRVATVLNNYPQTMIRVEGHTDSRGSEAYNQQLSEQRAGAVKQALVQRGVDPMRIQAIGYGETQPISSSNALNRRVNIVIDPIRQG